MRPEAEPEPHCEEALFRAVAELPAAQRATFLDGACHGDPGLRQRLEVLLKARDAGDTFLEPAPRLGEGDLIGTVQEDQASWNTDEVVGRMFGRYKLLERSAKAEAVFKAKGILLPDESAQTTQ